MAECLADIAASKRHSIIDKRYKTHKTHRAMVIPVTAASSHEHDYSMGNGCTKFRTTILSNGNMLAEADHDKRQQLLCTSEL